MRCSPLGLCDRTTPASSAVAQLSFREQGFVDCLPYGYHQPRGHGYYPDPLLVPEAGGVTLTPGVYDAFGLIWL